MRFKTTLKENISKKTYIFNTFIFINFQQMNS